MQSHNGEATLNRDDNKYRDNCDKVDFTKGQRQGYTGREVAKKDLKPGVRTTIIYGKKS